MIVNAGSPSRPGTTRDSPPAKRTANGMPERSPTSRSVDSTSGLMADIVALDRWTGTSSASVDSASHIPAKERFMATQKERRATPRKPTAAAKSQAPLSNEEIYQ